MRARLLRCRPFSTRILAVFLLVAGYLCYCYYYNNSLWTRQNTNSVLKFVVKDSRTPAYYEETHSEPTQSQPEQCPVVRKSKADINTASLFPKFDFKPSWLKTKEFWDKSFENRYEKLKKDSRRPPLKVFVVPHSHNDPGWLKTFEQYFEFQTKNILNNIVEKLEEYKNMTFIWTEISFLNAWWERSHPLKQKAFKRLVKEGRLEITTGGWVMPDEACTHIYALVDQLIEGHHWVKSKLGIAPKTGWSVDPFGHGATVPYLLDQSGIEGAIIQRIHFIWKAWFAKRQVEDFHWIPGWETKKSSLVVHNQPFDIYSVRSSCGPHPLICAEYDFRAPEYGHFSPHEYGVTDSALASKATALYEEYERIGSLTPHNVVLVPLGDDFRYTYTSEFDAQYTNYMKIFNYIKNNKDFKGDVCFGTPLDYFNTIKERSKTFPTLKGDFFVYSDIFSDGTPAYWSGYYTTRPYLKIVARQLEHHLRTAEILFTMVYNTRNATPALMAAEKKLIQSYENLITARRNLGVFQHHDAITGTSKARVMFDYGTKMLTSIYQCMRLQEAALGLALAEDGSPKATPVLQSEADWDSYGEGAHKLRLSLEDKNRVVVMNPLSVERTEVIALASARADVRVVDADSGRAVPTQISPVLSGRESGRRYLAGDAFRVLFVATVPALSARVYHLQERDDPAVRAQVFCMNCKDPDEQTPLFQIKNMMPGDIQLENNVLKLLINRNTGFLRQVYRKDIMQKTVVDLQFGAYQSAQGHSGAYLFMPDNDNPEIAVLNTYSNFQNLEDDNLIIVSGPVATEVIVMYLPFLIHTVTIYNVDDHALSHGILIENEIDFEPPPKNRDTELYMRLNTDVQNGDRGNTEFYTDQNGFQYQKRKKVSKLGIEANYYPITTMAWVQDASTRVSLLTSHAMGASGAEPGRLEVMLDRRTLYDDLRGVGEGVVDNKRTLFRNWLLVEALPGNASDNHTYHLPSPTAEYLSRSFNYPFTVYYVDNSETGELPLKPRHKFAEGFPDGLHLLALRTLPDPAIEQYPSRAAYMVLQRPGHECRGGTTAPARFLRNASFPSLHITNITSVSLTGLKEYAKLSGLHDIHLKPMEIKTFKIGF